MRLWKYSCVYCIDCIHVVYSWSLIDVLLWIFYCCCLISHATLLFLAWFCWTVRPSDRPSLCLFSLAKTVRSNLYYSLGLQKQILQTVLRKQLFLWVLWWLLPQRRQQLQWILQSMVSILCVPMDVPRNTVFPKVTHAVEHCLPQSDTRLFRIRPGKILSIRKMSLKFWLLIFWLSFLLEVNSLHTQTSTQYKAPPINILAHAIQPEYPPNTKSKIPQETSPPHKF